MRCIVNEGVGVCINFNCYNSKEKKKKRERKKEKGKAVDFLFFIYNFLRVAIVAYYKSPYELLLLVKTQCFVHHSALHSQPQGFTDTELTMSGVGSSFQWPVND